MLYHPSHVLLLPIKLSCFLSPSASVWVYQLTYLISTWMALHSRGVANTGKLVAMLRSNELIMQDPTVTLQTMETSLTTLHPQKNHRLMNKNKCIILQTDSSSPEVIQ